LVKRQRGSCVIADVWVLCGINNAEAEKVEVCTAVHRALDQLQTMNMPFDWTVAPGLLKCGKNRCLVTPEVLGEVH
jgi:hypothetical protein